MMRLLVLCFVAVVSAQNGYSRDAPLNRLQYDNAAPQAYNEASDDNEVHGDEIPGEAGTDYPIYSEAPDTGFSCDDQQYPGYYADPKAQCQAFYICQKGGASNALLCTNGTVFNQKTLVCDWWYNVDCSKSEEYYGENELIVKAMEEADARLAQQRVQNTNGYSQNSGNQISSTYGAPSAQYNANGVKPVYGPPSANLETLGNGNGHNGNGHNGNGHNGNGLNGNGHNGNGHNGNGHNGNGHNGNGKNGNGHNGNGKNGNGHNGNGKNGNGQNGNGKNGNGHNGNGHKTNGRNGYSQNGQNGQNGLKPIYGPPSSSRSYLPPTESLNGNGNGNGNNGNSIETQDINSIDQSVDVFQPLNANTEVAPSRTYLPPV